MLVQLACFYGERDKRKEYTFIFQFLIALDIGSHWFHMYTYVPVVTETRSITRRALL
jgi:hypothetical protein